MNKRSKRIHDPAKGYLQLEKLTDAEYNRLETYVKNMFDKFLDIIPIPNLYQRIYSVVRIFVSDSFVTILDIVSAFFATSHIVQTKTSILLEIKGFEVEFISIEHVGMGTLFYANSFAEVANILLRNEISLNATSLDMLAPFGTIQLSQNFCEVLQFFGLTLQDLYSIKSLEELFAFWLKSPFYDSNKAYLLTPTEMRCYLPKAFFVFCKNNPKKGIVPSATETLDFFGLRQDYLMSRQHKEKELRHKTEQVRRKIAETLATRGKIWILQADFTGGR